MSTALVPRLLVVENVSQISYAPDAKALLIQMRKRERDSEYLLHIEIPAGVLQELVAALKSFAEREGTSIESLGKQQSVQ